MIGDFHVSGVAHRFAGGPLFPLLPRCRLSRTWAKVERECQRQNDATRGQGRGWRTCDIKRVKMCQCCQCHKAKPFSILLTGRPCRAIVLRAALSSPRRSTPCSRPTPGAPSAGEPSHLSIVSLHNSQLHPPTCSALHLLASTHVVATSPACRSTTFLPLVPT